MALARSDVQQVQHGCHISIFQTRLRRRRGRKKCPLPLGHRGEHLSSPPLPSLRPLLLLRRRLRLLMGGKEAEKRASAGG